jgi:hypothetical protein
MTDPIADGDFPPDDSNSAVAPTVVGLQRRSRHDAMKAGLAE